MTLDSKMGNNDNKSDNDNNNIVTVNEVDFKVDLRGTKNKRQGRNKSRRKTVTNKRCHSG